MTKVKDHALKIFLKRSNNFAAIFNTFVPDLPQIDPGKLSEYDTASQFQITDSAGNTITKELLRDIIKKTDGNILSLYGIENQTEVDYSMPLRVFMYDGAAMIQQKYSWEEKSLMPVITLVLYFGERKWTGPKSILEMTKLPKDQWKNYENYHIRVIDVRRLEEEELEKLPNNIRYFFEFLQKLMKPKEFREYFKDNEEEISRLDKDTALAIAAFFGQEIAFNEKEGGKAMYSGLKNVFKEIEKESKSLGIKEGKAEGKAEGRAEERLNSSKYFKEQMEQLGINQTKIDEIIRNFENTK